MLYIIIAIAIILAIVLAIYFFMRPSYAASKTSPGTVASTGGSGSDGPSQQEKNEPLIIIKPLTEKQRFDRAFPPSSGVFGPQLENSGIDAYFK